MCGIFGMAGFSDRALLRKMGRLLSYRGPDDDGYFTDAGIGLGMRRLSIIDVKGGKQPVHNEKRDVLAVFNGEIYNYRELRQELEKKGHKFYTSSDTECIVHAYEEYGLRFPEKLNGMFAIALWDSGKKTLVLARDRLGKKPLYYTMLGRNLLFASEMKALLLHDGVKRSVNKKALHNYLSLRYCPGGETMLSGIYKLLPGRVMAYSRGKSSIKRYWDVKFRDENAEGRDFYLEGLKSLLQDSVRKRLISEVPLGVYLSGGLDSTAIVALMKESAPDINTFSIGFGLESDETGYARIASGFYGTNHREFVVEGTDLTKLLPKLVWHLDEPLADITNVPTYLISQLARKHVTVVLTGEGSDELFSGYAHEKAMLATQRMKNIMFSRRLASGAVKRLPLPLLNRFFEYPASMGGKGRERLAEYVRNMGNEPAMYSSLVSAFDDGEKKELCKFSGSPAESLFRPFFGAGTNLSNKMLLVDANVWLPNYILPRLDRMTMANSIEGRAPFLDYRLVEFASKLPPGLRTGDKYVLRRALRGMLPPQIVNRKKRTFITPVHFWGERQLLDMCSILHESEFFRKSFIEKMLGDYRNSKLIRERQLWALITFELWHRTFIESGGLRPLKKF